MWDWFYVFTLFVIFFFIVCVVDFTVEVVRFFVKKFERQPEKDIDNEYIHDWDQYWDER